MDKSNKKIEILEAALDLFSTYGYEATSIAQIADAVGIKKASLYFHFASKQDILISLVEKVTEEYNKHSIFAKVGGGDSDYIKNQLSDFHVEEFAKMIMNQMAFTIHDPHVSKVRRMLVLEQFRNAELSKIQEQRNYGDILSFHTKVMKHLMDAGFLKEADPQIMAAQFSFPITVWISVCDREPQREAEIMELAEKHVMQFFEVYKK